MLVEAGSWSATASGLESRLSALNQSIIEANNSSCPLKTTTKSHNKSWWSSKLSELRKTVRKLFNKAKRTGNWEDYRCSLTAYNKKINTAKQKSFRKFSQSAYSTPESARLHKALARSKTDTVLKLKDLIGHLRPVQKKEPRLFYLRFSWRQFKKTRSDLWSNESHHA